MKIGLLLRANPPGRDSPIMREVIQLLSEWGADVDTIYPAESPICLSEGRPHHDLYVLKSRSQRALNLAAALHATGARIVNPFPVAAMLSDKAIVCRILKWAGIPTPRAYAATRPSDLTWMLSEGPLIIKPSRGSQGKGIQVVRDSADLDQMAADAGPVDAQHYKTPDRGDHKIYCIGGQVFGVERDWPAETYRQKLGRPLTISSDLRDIALRSGCAFGTDIFGLDVIISDGRPYVVDVNNFPGFKGVPNAALRLADYIYGYAQGSDRVESPTAWRGAVR